MRKKGRRTAGICLGLLALLICAALILRPDWRYLSADAVSRLWHSAEVEELSEEKLTLTDWTMEQLLDAGAEEDRSLMLINTAHCLPADFLPRLTDYHDTGVLMDEEMAADYAALSQAVEERFGERLLIRSSYRTREEQEETILQDGEVAAALDASEHQAGLALDVYVAGYAGRAFLKTEAGRWVNDHCWEYGFIIRYPYYGTGSTGIPYEPWHLRYVGRPHAELAMQNSRTLEQYIDRLGTDRYWRIDDVMITRQTEEPFRLPETWEAVTVSPDNRGGWVFTVQLPKESD